MIPDTKLRVFKVQREGRLGFSVFREPLAVLDEIEDLLYEGGIGTKVFVEMIDMDRDEYYEIAYPSTEQVEDTSCPS